ncbi:MAG: ribonuclease P protein subunit [Candidatus Aenigmarchaeota archaeon]|nr:ribonuclease P protein subunit [Candidatus Aenigmarchaeota archaeon]
MRTPKNILRHELIGLECKVVNAKNKSQIGLHGRIVDETKKTIVLETKKGMKRVFKAGSIFHIKLGRLWVEILGDDILARPEDRIKKKIRVW